MINYNELSLSDGAKYLPRIKNFVFKTVDEDHYFVTSSEYEELALCAEFRLADVADALSLLYFFVDDEDTIELLRTYANDIYLYGTYNSVTVCQMRVRGTVVHEIEHLEERTLRARIRTNLSDLIEGKLVRRCERILDLGQLFSFHPVQYAYRVYERG